VFHFQSTLRAGVAAFALAVGGLAVPQAQAQTSLTLPSAELSDSLNALSRAAGVEILANPDLLRGRTAPAVEGAPTPEAALEQLLQGSGLGYEKRGDSFLIVRKANSSQDENVQTADASGANTDYAGLPHTAMPDPIDMFVVTGSRIPRPELESTMPIGILDMSVATKQGKTTVYETVLQDIAVGPGNGPYNSAPEGQYDGGMATIELRNMGVSRSLTLIDGRRRVSGAASSSAVDINMIPPSMIDRIEIITGGAAAVYGADAVTGAVNVITKKDFDGFQVSATAGTSDHGGGSKYQLSLLAGTKFSDDRGSMIIGGTYVKNEPIYFYQRYSKDTNLRFSPNPENTGPDDGIPNRITYYHGTNMYLQPVANIYVDGKTYLLNPDGSAYAGQYDTCFAGCGTSRDGGDGGMPQSQYWSDFLIAPIENASFIGRFDYELADWINYSLRFDYGRSKYDAYRRPYRDDDRTIWLNGAGGATAYLDNPYLPDSFREIMVANGLTSTPLRRTYENIGQMTDYSDRQSITVGNTFTGQLPGGFEWEAFWQYGRSTNDIHADNVPMASRWIAARDVIADPVTGDPVCRDEEARAMGCVPFNIFSTDALTPEQRDWMIATRRKHRQQTQTIYGADIAGSPFALPAGDVQAVLGFEHRKESVHNMDDNGAAPPANELSHLGAWAPYEPELKASNDVSELYGELVVPVLSDLPFARRLTVEGAYRYSDYSDFDSTNTWKAGVNWSPIQGLTFRSVKSRSVRVPNFGELYSNRAVQEIGLTDPCMSSYASANPTRAQNCAALLQQLGIGGAALPDQIYTGNVLTGGNPDVTPETSDSWSAGVVLQPSFLPGFDLTIDYWDIKISNMITALSRNNVMQLCVDLPNIDNQYCSRITRDENGYAMWVDTSYMNVSELAANGIDIGANYGLDVGMGRLSVALRANYLIKYEATTLPGFEQSLIVYDGGYQNPRVRANLNLSYQMGRWDIGLNNRFWGSAKNYTQPPSDEEYDDNHVESRLYNDLTVGWQMTEGAALRVGINNLFDVQPPYHPRTYYQGGGGVYDVYGRYFFTNINAKF